MTDQEPTTAAGRQFVASFGHADWIAEVERQARVAALTTTEQPARAPRPDKPCPKCGNEFGFFGVHPTYESNSPYAELRQREWLSWRCRVCSYEVETPTADG